MNLRIHVAIFIVFFAAHSVSSSINSASSSSVAKQQVSGIDQKAVDDLYIDDEGDDDIQLADEASGLGPYKPAPGVVDEVEEEEEGEEEDEEEEEEDEDPEPIEAAKKAKDAGTTAAMNNKNSTAATTGVGSSSSSADFEDDVVVPPKVSPVAASPTMGKPPSPVDVDDEEDDEDFDGASGSGAGAGSHHDDVNEEEEEDEDDFNEGDDGGIDIPSIITEPVPPRQREPMRSPERNPEVVVVAPPTTPTKAPKESAPQQTPSPPSVPPPAVDEHDEVVPHDPMTTAAPGPIDPAQSPDRGHNDIQVQGHKPDERQASFFAQPELLAAVICGAVVGLLCAILLVMFIVYRMRKKDEGSYVLDEPKRNSPNSHQYNKNSREFYA